MPPFFKKRRRAPAGAQATGICAAILVVPAFARLGAPAVVASAVQHGVRTRLVSSTRHTSAAKSKPADVFPQGAAAAGVASNTAAASQAATPIRMSVIEV